MKNLNDPIGNRNRDLLACSAAPQKFKTSCINPVPTSQRTSSIARTKLLTPFRDKLFLKIIKQTEWT